MRVTPPRVGLPDLDKRVAHRVAITVEHASVDDDPLSLRLTRVLPREVVVELTNPTFTEHGACHLGQRLPEYGQRTVRGSGEIASRA